MHERRDMAMRSKSAGAITRGAARERGLSGRRLIGLAGSGTEHNPHAKSPLTAAAAKTLDTARLGTRNIAETWRA